MEEMKVIKDGNAWAFVLPNFENLQVSPSFWIAQGAVAIDADMIYKYLLEQDSIDKS